MTIEQDIDNQLGVVFEKLTQAIDGVEKRDTQALQDGVEALFDAACGLFGRTFGTGFTFEAQETE